MMNELLAYEHRTDLRREAATFARDGGGSRVASRRDLRTRTTGAAVAARVSSFVHRRPAPMGCEA